MAKIERIEIFMVDLIPPVIRTDAIQSFVSQETPIVQITDSDGAKGTGYSYTIGTGGSSVVALLADHLAPTLIGKDADEIDGIWQMMLFTTHATTVGAISSLAFAAIDTALWDLRCRKAELPLYKLAGGARASAPVYTTEGGWLHINIDDIVADCQEAKEKGFQGAKVKVGKPHGVEDRKRLEKVRSAMGDEWSLMTDCNQAFTADEAIRRAKLFDDLNLAWIEEPMPADDVNGHARLNASTSIPVAVGESLYSVSQFCDYMARNAASIIQVDVARIGGITPWLKVAHIAEGFNLPVCPHFLMELHVSLVCAVSNGRWVEYIPQLDSITGSHIQIKDGRAYAPNEPGIGIDWDWDAIDKKCAERFRHDIRG